MLKKKSLLIAVLKDVFLNYIEITKAEVKWGVRGGVQVYLEVSHLW